MFYFGLEDCGSGLLIEDEDGSDRPRGSEGRIEFRMEVGVEIEVTSSPVAEWASSGAD